MVVLDPYIKKSYMLIAITLVLSISIQYGLIALGVPWPIAFGAVIAMFMTIPILIRRRYMSRMRGYGGDSGNGGGGGFFGMGSQGGSSGVRYVCLACNNKHKGGSCPRCGSKMQRADF